MSEESAPLVDVTMENNRRHGMTVSGNVPVSASGCTITGNSQHGVRVSNYAAGSGAFSLNDSAIATHRR